MARWCHMSCFFFSLLKTLKETELVFCAMELELLLSQSSKQCLLIDISSVRTLVSNRQGATSYIYADVPYFMDISG